MSEKQALIEFHGDQIQTVRTEEGIYVAMKPVVENMGLDWKSQRAKLNLNQRWGVIALPLKTAGGNQSVMCIPLRKLNGWLFSVNPDKVLPILKQKVIDYQEECFHVLYNHWHGKKDISVANIPNEMMLPDFRDPVAAARAWADAKESELKLQIELKEAQPKIDFAEAIEKSEDSISVREMAKILYKEGLKIGQNKLFEKMRELKLIFINSQGKNEPYQTSIKAGWLKYEEFSTQITRKSDQKKVTKLCHKIKITGKGQIHISKKLNIKPAIVLKKDDYESSTLS